VDVGSVAYPTQPQLPGWIDATLSLVVGWFVSAVAMFLLFIAASLVGAISQPYASHAGVVNEWPYFDSSLWSLLANLAVILLALVLATTATSWWLRRKHAQVSDGRLAVVLLFTGWSPDRGRTCRRARRLSGRA
jgi:ABC-type sulfate transport system permease component